VGGTSLAKRPLHVGHQLDGGHRRGAPGDHRREVPAAGAEVERSTVPFWCPDLFDEPAAGMVVLLGFAIPAELVIVHGSIA
jgi:hypothetical protein